MEWIGFALFAVAVLGGGVLLARWMTRRGRNKGDDHGGGVEAFQRIGRYFWMWR